MKSKTNKTFILQKSRMQAAGPGKPGGSQSVPICASVAYRRPLCCL